MQDRYNTKKAFGFIQSSSLRLKASNIRKKPFIEVKKL